MMMNDLSLLHFRKSRVASQEQPLSGDRFVLAKATTIFTSQIQHAAHGDGAAIKPKPQHKYFKTAQLHGIKS